MTSPTTHTPVSDPAAADPAFAPTVADPAAAPAPVRVNGELREIAPGTTLAEVVAEFSAAPSGVAAAVNESVVPRGAWAATRLGSGDRVEILTAVQGG